MAEASLGQTIAPAIVLMGAAVVADQLEEACGVATARVEPIGWLEGGDSKVWGVGLPATAIEFALPKK